MFKVNEDRVPKIKVCGSEPRQPVNRSRYSDLHDFTEENDNSSGVSLAHGVGPACISHVWHSWVERSL
jgi:hypothetical protein